MRITLINPQHIEQTNDIYGTQVPYLPLSLAYLETHLSKKYKGHHIIEIIDAYADDNKINKVCKDKINELSIYGMTNEEIVHKIHGLTDIIIIYAAQIIQHNQIIEIIKDIRDLYPDKTIIVMENSQSVVAYSLSDDKVVSQLLGEDDENRMADFIVVGEPEITMCRLIDTIEKYGNKDKSKHLIKVNGILYMYNDCVIKTTPRTPMNAYELSKLPFPDWSEKFNIREYWHNGLSHAPLKKGKCYIPILTSRGCQSNCNFCIIPKTNNGQWRGRSPKNVVDEINEWLIDEVHIEDLNATIDRKRIIGICQEILDRGLEHLSYKLCSGIKLETIDKTVLYWLRIANFTYISFSPESRSYKVMQSFNKKFDYTHGIHMTELMHEWGITSQACFIIGSPIETDNDRKQTWKYIKTLVKAGLSEIVLSIHAPLVGSKFYEKNSSDVSYVPFSKLTFTPKYRKDFHIINRWRFKTYLKFMMLRVWYHPIETFKDFIYCRTKMMMGLRKRLGI